jgi:heptosyltransferase-3
MKAPRSVLVVVTRRIGDVLLTTPLIRTLKLAWPDAAIDVLVFAGTQSALAANPDVRRVLTIAERPRLDQHLALVFAILRRYDIALSAVPSDRPTVYTWLAGRWRAGLVLDEPKHRWKTWLMQRWVPFDNLNTHTVLMHLALAATLGIPAHHEVVVKWTDNDCKKVEQAMGFPLTKPYAVLHTFPKFSYKMWRRAGWIDVARWLRAQGLQVVLSGGPDAAEIDYVAAIAREIPDAIDVCGKLTLNQAACLIAHARAYVGPDTSITHIAAALGVPVVAIYGPTDPIKWGPWPAGYARNENPWRRFGTQRVNNVTLIQGAGACVPCRKEGCERHIASFSDCLQQLSTRHVTAALAAMLSAAHPRAAHPG